MLSYAALSLIGTALACRQKQQPSPTTKPAESTALPSVTPSPTISAAPTPATTATPAPIQQVTVTIDAIENCFTDFAITQSALFTETSGINVTWRSVVPWKDYQAAIASRAAAGDLDIIQAPIGLAVQAWARFGYLRALNAYVLPTNPATRGIFPGAISACSYHNQLYGLPFAASPGDCLLLYNPALFTEAALDMPTNAWTLDDLVSAASNLNRLDALGHLKQYGYIPQYHLPSYLVMLRLFGIELLDENADMTPANTLYPILGWYQSMLHERLVFPRPYELTYNPSFLFHQGQAAMLRLSFGRLTELSQELEWVQAVLMPPLRQNGQHGGCITGLASCVTVNSPRPLESIAWCQFLADAETGVRMFEHGCGVPGCQAASWQDPRVVRRFPISAACSNLAMLAFPEPVPLNLRQSELYQAWLSSGEAFWNGRVSSEQFADAFFAAGKRIINQPELDSKEQL